MKHTIIFLFSILLFWACAKNKKLADAPPMLFPKAKTYQANSSDGFIINPVTGDSVEPIIFGGDTLKTGVPIPTVGKVIDPDSVDAPIVIAASKTNDSYNAHANVHPIPEAVKSFSVNKDSLTVIFLEDLIENDTVQYFTNYLGDSIKTGIPVPAIGRKVKAVMPANSPAQLPMFKDGAIADLQYLDVDQGMASSYVESIIEDNRGNIWIGTDKGASMYNGRYFRHFTEKEGLTNSTVNAILEDQYGNIWFGTYEGVVMYDGESFTHYSTKEGFIADYVWSIMEDKSGNIWFGSNGGASRYDGVSFTHFTINEGLPYLVVNSICEDKSGNLWFSNSYGGVSMYDGESFTILSEEDGLPRRTALRILADQKGNIWISTWGGGLTKYDGVFFTHFNLEDGLSDNVVLSMMEDQKGNLWCGTLGGGVSMYDGSSFTHFTKKEGLPSDDVNTFMEDQNGNIWIGTGGGGVCKFNGSSFTYFTKDQGLLDHRVWSILEDGKGNLWFGTDRGGVSKYDGKTFTHFTTKEGLSNNTAFSMLEDNKGNIWFGTRGSGVCKYDGESFTTISWEQGLSNSHIVAMLEDKHGNLWLGTRGGGVNMFNGKFLTHFTMNEGLAHDVVFSILEDQNGNIWFGTGSGASRYDGKTFTHLTEKEGLPGNLVHSILEDQGGNLWFGTSEGLCKYDGKSFTYFTTKEGLSSNSIASIQEDKDGNIWVSTDNGINCILGIPAANDSNEESSPQILVFKKNDGLKGVDFYSRSVCLDSRNRLWWGSGKGITTLDLGKFTRSQEPPILYLKGLNIQEQYIDYRNTSDSLAHDIEYIGVQAFENFPLGLELAYDQDHLTFHFVGHDGYAPHKIRYSYIMEGLDTKWSPVSDETKADYRNLPYGSYTFKVRSIGESGSWSKALEYPFTIRPPWWHTWWARIGYGMFTILLIWGIVRWRTASLKRRQRELEREVDVATKEIREQKEVIQKEKERSEELLLNILPEEVAQELKDKGYSDAHLIDQVTVLFTDFKGFTALSEKVTPKKLVDDLHECFSAFDRICEKYGIEKIKTIGDAYMAAGGLPSPNKTHPQDVVQAALEMAKVIEDGKAKKIAVGLPYFEIRIGVNTGPVVAGIVGVKKFQYDIWGDTVNTASRMESSGEVGKVNISENTFKLLKDKPQYKFESRGKIEAKGKGAMEMFFVSITSL